MRSLGAGWLQRSRRPYLAVGWLWFLGTLVPVIGLLRIGYADIADRFTYVPTIGIAIMMAWGVPRLFARWHVGKPQLAILGVGVVLALADIVETLDVGDKPIV